MCGIFGIIATSDADVSPKALRSAVKSLFLLSQSRGKEAAGVAVLTDDSLLIYKEAIPAGEMIRRPEYRELFEHALPKDSRASGRLGRCVAVIGHSRLVTTGGQNDRLNNQPVINRGAVGIHNGIVVNAERLWRDYPELPRHGSVDSEVIVGLLRHFLARDGSLISAARETFRMIDGAASIAVLFDDLDQIVLASNNGSLYLSLDEHRRMCVFASERHILQQHLRRNWGTRFDPTEIEQVRPGRGWLIDTRNLQMTGFGLSAADRNGIDSATRPAPRRLEDVEPRANGSRRRAVRSSVLEPGRFSPDRPPPEPGFDQAAIDALRRCTRCILPETMPFITFDEQGVCNYCRHHLSARGMGRARLEEIIAPHRQRDGAPDCLVGLSGGRDSSYGLHYIKTELGMNPIAFTYDWGMVTDLARRNISRLCGKLGIEHILVSADISRKRDFIRRNVSAWLRRPRLGMIPLFMAGDKQYFYQAKKLKRQTGVPLIFLCENMLERTHFKAGFAGTPPFTRDADHVYTLPILSKLKMIGFYAREYLLNPGYLNRSVVDTLFAYACYYLISRDYLNLYRFIDWDEAEIERTLIGEYGWETSPDTPTTWRIGDGTASFYNYIYYTIAGFSEHDTFRSNQVREGLLSREQARELARRENRPRWESIKWYCDIIDVDFEEAVRRINAAPKLYHRGGRR